MHSTGSQRIRHDWATEQQHSTLWFCEFVIFTFHIEIIILQLLLSLPCSLVYVFLHIPSTPFFKTLLEHSCFTMLCQHLLYSKVNQLYVYIYTSSFQTSFPFRSPQSTEQSSLCYTIGSHSYLFYTQQCTNVNLNLPTQIPYPIHTKS